MNQANRRPRQAANLALAAQQPFCVAACADFVCFAPYRSPDVFPFFIASSPDALRPKLEVLLRAWRDLPTSVRSS
jgi:hypothetical protein